MAHGAALEFHTAALPLAVTSDQLSQIARGLHASFLGNPVEPQAASLIAQLLSYAAEAEQVIADQKRRIDELEELSATDELTGLPNRRAFLTALERSLAEAGRHGDSGLVGFIDVNGLKAINDAHGHAAGNAAILAVARTLQAAVRTTDIVARLHGDEFAVLLCRSDPRRSVQLLARLRGQLQGIRFAHGARRLKASASLGAASYGPGDSVQRVLTAADEAMYAAKRARTSEVTPAIRAG